MNHTPMHDIYNKKISKTLKAQIKSIRSIQDSMRRFGGELGASLQNYLRRILICQKHIKNMNINYQI